MWILKHVASDIQFSLLPNKCKYKIGRLEADFVLTGDKTISREHASLLLSTNDQKLEVIGNGTKRSVFIRHSKNEDFVEVQEKTELFHGCFIRFGRGKFEFEVEKRNLVCLTSTLSDSHKKEMQMLMKRLGGHIESKITEDCSFIVMSEALVTTKLLQAMIKGIPIVEINYFKEVEKNIAACVKWSNPQNFTPKLEEQFLMFKNEFFTVYPQRKNVFQGKTFYFFSTRQYDYYKDIIESANGICLCIKNQSIVKSKLIAPESIVIKLEKESAATQNLSQAMQQIANLERYIRNKGLRIIPITEINLAIVFFSCEKYCNPRYGFTNFPVDPKYSTQNDALVLNTHNIQESHRYHMDVIDRCSVPETNIDEKEKFIMSPLEINNEQSVAYSIENEKNHDEENSTHYSQKRPLEFDTDTTEDSATPAKKPKNQSNNMSNWYTKSTKQNIGEGITQKAQETNLNLNRKRLLSDSESDCVDEDNIFGFRSKKRAKMKLTQSQNNTHSAQNNEFGFQRKKIKTFESQQSKQNSKRAAESQSNETSVLENAMKNVRFYNDSKTSGWISKSVKSEVNNSNIVKREIEAQKDDLTSSELFVIKQKEISVSNSNLQNPSQSTSNSKNFKKFVKKINYKPQQVVVETITTIPGASQYPN